MTILFENVNFLSGATGATTKRTPAQRWADILNVKDFGAKGDGSTDDTAAIQAAVTAMYAVPSKSCILYFPAGTYVVSSTIDISNSNIGSNYTSGIIRGSGRQATTIIGTINSGFIFSQADGVNGPEEISNLGLSNASTVIGTGALFINFSGARIIDCGFLGMINILMPFNIFNASIENCSGGSNSDVTTGHAGTFGIAGYICNISGWRTTSPYQAAIQVYGGNSGTISYCGNENCTVGIVAGMATTWASACTVAGNVLTVGGNLGSGFTQFNVGTEIFMKGLTTPADWGISPVDASICTITETHNENPSRTGTGFAGTYTISRSATISSPVPCVGRYASVLSSAVVQSYQSEACYYILFVRSAAGCSFISVSGGSTPTECVNAFGVTGFCANSGIYMYSGGGCSFVSGGPNNNPYNASWYFDPSQVNSVALFNCMGQKLSDNVTGTSSKIDNGFGSAGTILNVVSYAGSTIGIGMKVTGSGVSANTVITGNHTTDGTLTGTGGTGTYRVNNSQNVTGTAITIHTGDDWILPTADAALTGLQMYNCNSANLPAGYTSGLANAWRTYASLPGNVGSNGNFPVQFGMVYAIKDGQKSGGGVAAIGDVIQGGGTQKIGAFYNGTNWTRSA